MTEDPPEKIEANEDNSEDEKMLATGESTKKSDKSAMQTIGEFQQLLVSLIFRKAGKVWCGGARESH